MQAEITTGYNQIRFQYPFQTLNTWEITVRLISVRSFGFAKKSSIS